jgi:hypothetical protein
MAAQRAGPTFCELPELPQRARPRLDQHGFREQGTSIANARIEDLRATIASLAEQKDVLKGELGNASTKAAKEMQSALEIQRDVQLHGFDQAPDRQALLQDVVGQVTKTRLALAQLVKTGPEDGPKQSRTPNLTSESEKKLLRVGALRKALRNINAELKTERGGVGEHEQQAPNQHVIARLENSALEIRNQIDHLENQLKDEEAENSGDEARRLKRHREELAAEEQQTQKFYAEQRERNAALGLLGREVARGRYGDTDIQTAAGGETYGKEDEHFLGQLEKLISIAKDLEWSHIKVVRDHHDKVQDLEHLITALVMEISLEKTWLAQFDGPKTKRDADSTAPRLDAEHLSGQKMPAIYKPLEKGEYRVLVVLPAPEPYYPLICKLETWPSHAADSPPYAALSYFWGPEVHNGRIYLLPDDYESPSPKYPTEWGTASRHATRIPIRNNLFRALLRFRKTGPSARPVALWVDYMCINQDDTHEKTEQLSRMVNIYSKATNVCIWLGESDDSQRSDNAMRFITTIMDFATLDRHAHDKEQAKNWFALGELMRDRWFSRRWVVQEVALARKASVHCGGSFVRWSDFADAATLLVTHQEDIRLLFDPSQWREGRKTLGDVNAFGASILLVALNNLFRRKPNGDIKKPIKTIESLVTSLKTFDTGDGRDLIYSLVCISSDTSHIQWQHEQPKAPSQRSFQVDYSRSELTVYTEFTEFCVLSSRSLDIICRPWAMPLRPIPNRADDKLPSWIPLLSSSEFGIPEEVYSGRKNGENLVGSAGSPNYEASRTDGFDVSFEVLRNTVTSAESELGNSVANLSVINNEDLSLGDSVNFSAEARAIVLCAAGFRLGTIRGVSPRNTGGAILRESLKMGGWNGFDQDTDGVPDPIWRTLVADRDQQGRVPPSWYQRACLRCLEIADTYNNGDLNVGELLQGDAGMLRQYLERVRNVTWNRRFFTAEAIEQVPEITVKENGVPQDDSPAALEQQDELPAHDDEQLKAGGAGEAPEEANGGAAGNQTYEESTEYVHTEDEDREEARTRGDRDAGYLADEEIYVRRATRSGKDRRRHYEVEATSLEEELRKLYEEEGDDVLYGEQGGYDEERSHRGDEEEEKGENGKEADETEQASKHDAEELCDDQAESVKEEEGDYKSMDEDMGEEPTEEKTKDKSPSFGLCPPDTKVGDIICILHGCSVPVVLREKQGGYMSLVGEAYVHGVMDGEALEAFRERGSVGEEKFRIL